MSSIKPGIYEHYKGQRYEVIGTAIHSETVQPMVIYKQLYQSDHPVGTCWVRPLSMFQEMVRVDEKLVPRFRLV